MIARSQSDMIAPLSSKRSSAWRTWVAIDALLGRIPGVVVVLALVFLYVPIGVIVVLSFNAEAVPRFPISGWSSQWYVMFFNDDRLRAALMNSILLGILSTAISLGLAGLASLGLMHVGRGQSTMLALLLAPLVVPGVVFGIALLTSTNSIGIERGWPLLLIGHAVQFVPYAIIVLTQGLRLIDQRYEEAALMLGANYWEAFREVTLPLLRPAFIASALICFVQSLQDFDASQFWAVPTAETLPVRLYSQTRQALTPTVNVTGVVMLVLPLGAVIAATMLRRAVESRSQGGGALSTPGPTDFRSH